MRGRRAEVKVADISAGLKSRVSVVQFHPGPLSHAGFQAFKTRFGTSRAGRRGLAKLTCGDCCFPGSRLVHALDVTPVRHVVKTIGGTDNVPVVYQRDDIYDDDDV